MTLWKGVWRELHWIWLLLFPFDQRNHSFFHQRCVKLRGLYFSIGEWMLLKTLAALSLLLCDPLLYLLNYAIKILGKSTLIIQEKRRENKHCVCQGKELKKKVIKELIFFHGCFHQGILLIPDWGGKNSLQTTVVGLGPLLTTRWCYSLTVKWGPSQ